MLDNASIKRNPSTPGHATIVALVVCGLVSRTTSLSAMGPSPRLRSTNPMILASLNEGAERSATFRALVAAIEQTNGIVYVEFGYCAFGHVAGCLLPFIASGHGDRYVRIIVSPEKRRLSHDQLLALIAHELQHAREVLDRPEIVDLETMDAMYRKLGTAIVNGAGGYETSAARAAGAAVLSELVRSARVPTASAQGVARPGSDRPAKD